MVVPPAQGYFCRCESSSKIPGRTLLPPHDGPGIREEHLEEGNHPGRGACRRACSHLRRVRRRESLPDHIVQPDQGRRRLGRPISRPPPARRCRVRRARASPARRGLPARRARRATPVQPALRVRRVRPRPAGTRFAPGATRRTTTTRTGPGTSASAAARSPRSPARPARSRSVAATGSRRPVTTGSTRPPSRTEAASSRPSPVAWTGKRIRSSRTTTPGWIVQVNNKVNAADMTLYVVCVNAS